MIICIMCFSIFVSIPVGDICPYCGMEGDMISLEEYLENMPTSFLFWISEASNDDNP